MARRRRRRGAAAVEVASSALPEYQFCTCIRCVKRMSADKVEPLLLAAEGVLSNLGQKADGVVVEKLPKQGSDQVDILSMITWMNKIKKGDGDAIEQLKMIHATGNVRR